MKKYFNQSTHADEKYKFLSKKRNKIKEYTVHVNGCTKHKITFIYFVK